MANPFFSVIITTYNRPERLIKAIDSVLSQEFQDFELIIVNDGSTISYENVLEHIQGNEKINYYYKINEERSIARNYGIDKAKGEWICFLDDDDIYYSQHLTARYNSILLEKMKNIIFYSPTVKRFSNGVLEVGEIPLKDYHGIDVLVYNPFTINTVCLHSVIAKKHLFNPDLTYWEDFEYWLRIILKENLKTSMIRQHTSEYIFHGTNTVSNWSINFLMSKLKTFEYLKANYSQNIPNWFLQKKLYDTYLGLADCFAKEKKRKHSINYLVKALKNKTGFSNFRPILGVIKNLITIAPVE